ncbi:unnamed protein product [Lathyrus oleraceus]
MFKEESVMNSKNKRISSLNETQIIFREKNEPSQFEEIQKWMTATTTNVDDGDETRLESNKKNYLQRGQMTIGRRTPESFSLSPIDSHRCTQNSPPLPSV